MGTQNRDVEAFRFCLLAVMNKNSNNDISYNFNSGQIFHTFKLCVKSIFLGWHLLTDNSLYMIYMRQHIIRPTFFPSYRAKYKRAIIRCPTKRPDFLQSELSSVSVWGLKGLDQWNYPIWVKLRVRMRTERVTSMELSPFQAIDQLLFF